MTNSSFSSNVMKACSLFHFTLEFTSFDDPVLSNVDVMSSLNKQHVILSGFELTSNKSLFLCHLYKVADTYGTLLHCLSIHSDQVLTMLVTMCRISVRLYRIGDQYGKKKKSISDFSVEFPLCSNEKKTV